MRKLILLLFLSGCVAQDLSVSYQLSSGMTKDEVVSILGPPIKSDFYKNIDEWHYCSTGLTTDSYLALFFLNDTLIAKKNYTVVGMDGSCQNFIKRGNYSEPDVVVELRRGY